MYTFNTTATVTVTINAKGIKVEFLGIVQEDFHLNKKNYMHTYFRMSIKAMSLLAPLYNCQKYQ